MYAPLLTHHLTCPPPLPPPLLTRPAEASGLETAGSAPGMLSMEVLSTVPETQEVVAGQVGKRRRGRLGR